METRRTPSGIEYDGAGVGEAVVLLHAGVADRRMWEPQWAAIAGRFRAIRADARGFGATAPPTGPWGAHLDVAEVLADAGVGRAHLVGASMGAGTAAAFALWRPAAVRSLVLAAPGGAFYAPEPPENVRAFWREEARLVDAGDLDAAVELNLRTWVDGPDRRPDEVDPDVRAFVGRMQRDAFDASTWDAEELDPEGAPPIERLAELAMPLLVVVGDRDQPHTVAIARRIGAEAPRARLVVIPGVAHMLTLERPTEFERLVLEFLGTT